jgi:YggT family protein
MPRLPHRAKPSHEKHGRYDLCLRRVAAMLFQVVSFVLDVAVGLLAGACLLRLYMLALRAGFSNQIGVFLFAMTNWLVLPMRRFIPAIGWLDTASLLAAYLLVLAKTCLLLWVAGAAPAWEFVPFLALFGLARLALSALSALVLVNVVLSWVQAPHVVKAVLDRLCDPLLRPLRRWLPRVGAVDLSPLLLLVLLQVAAILLSGALPLALR